MSGTILSRAGWNTSGFLGEHSVSDKSLACGCGIRRVKEVKHSTLSAFSYFVLKIRASEGRKEVRGLGMKGGIRKRGRAAIRHPQEMLVSSLTPQRFCCDFRDHSKEHHFTHSSFSYSPFFFLLFWLEIINVIFFSLPNYVHQSA